MDFGLARAMSSTPSPTDEPRRPINRHRAVPFTRACPRERVILRGSSDLYSTGWPAVRAAYRAAPFTGDSPAPSPTITCGRTLPPPVGPDVPPWADAIVLKAMASPRPRYQTAADMRRRPAAPPPPACRWSAARRPGTTCPADPGMGTHDDGRCHPRISRRSEEYELRGADYDTGVGGEAAAARAALDPWDPGRGAGDRVVAVWPITCCRSRAKTYAVPLVERRARRPRRRLRSRPQHCALPWSSDIQQRARRAGGSAPPA